MKKKRFRNIAALVICSLVALAALQAFWSQKMYSELKSNIIRKASTALEKTALQEAILRGNKMSFPENSISSMYVNKSNVSDEKEQPQDKIIKLSANRVQSIKISKTKAEAKSDKNNFFFSINVNVQPEFDFESVDVGVLDSLFKINLKETGITGVYNLKIKNMKNGKIVSKNDNYIHNSFRVTYIDNSLFTKYIAEIENPFKEMEGEIRGIIISSILIVILLSLTFSYMLRTLFKQKALEEMRRDFSHNITHELKTPIAVAYAANDAMINFSVDNNPQKRKEYLNIIKVQLDTLSSMVERILSLSMEEQPDFSLNTGRFDIRQELELLSEIYKARYDKEVTIAIDVNPENLYIYADKFHLRNVIGNLIDNAIKYSNESVKISLEARIGSKDKTVNIIVSDNGIGMTKEQQEHIFEKFYRVPTGNIQDTRGYGLGLFYAKMIIEKHGGTISVESKKGAGTTFTISLRQN